MRYFIIGAKPVDLFYRNKTKKSRKHGFAVSCELAAESINRGEGRIVEAESEDDLDLHPFDDYMEVSSYSYKLITKNL